MEQNKISNLLNKEINIKEIFLKVKTFLVKLFNNYLVEIVLAINILYTLIGSYKVMMLQKLLVDFANKQILLMLFNVTIIMFMIAKNKIDKSKKTTYLFMFLILLFGIISVIYARVPRIALAGVVNRYEGIYAVSYYLTLMFLATLHNKNTKKITINIIILTGIIQAIYGIFQALKLSFVTNPIPGIALGFISNQNFFGTFMLLCLSFSMGLFIEENKRINKTIYIIETIILTTSLLMSNTTSVEVGLLFVTIFVAIYCIRKKKILKLITIFIVLVLTTVVNTNLGKTKILNNIGQASQEATQIVQGNTKDNYGSGRIFLWRETLKIIPKYFIKRCRT